MYGTTRGIGQCDCGSEQPDDEVVRAFFHVQSMLPVHSRQVDELEVALLRERPGFEQVGIAKQYLDKEALSRRLEQIWVTLHAWA